MNISLRFARDLNSNSKIEKEEIVKNFSDLEEYDKNGDKELTGAELNNVYFEYSKDVWLEGNRRHVRESDEFTQIIRLRKLGFAPPKIDLDATFRPR